MKTDPRPIENVWDYPRPPRLERVRWRILVKHQGVVVADAADAYRVLETSHPPVYYIPPSSVRTGCLRPSQARPTWCEWKGQAQYLDLVLEDSVSVAVAWRYPTPTRDFEAIAGAVAFYPSRVDRCTVDGETVRPQAGDFYGGWITSWIEAGRRGFKGGPGTWGW